MLEFKNVSMRYPKPRGMRGFLCNPFKREYKQVLHDISIKISKGESIALLGVNGAGKTTLLKLTGGLLYPSSGNVIVNGHDTVADNDHCRDAVGYVMNEERSFYWRLSGYENLEFFAALDNIFDDDFKERVKSLLELTGLSEAADTRVSNYSSGMRQRLAIARGLLSEPNLLLLDEPTRSLDPKGALKMREFIRNKVRSEQMSLIVATHSFDEAESLCSRILIIYDGRIYADMTTQEVAEKYGSIRECYMELVGGEGVICD